MNIFHFSSQAKLILYEKKFHLPANLTSNWVYGAAGLAGLAGLWAVARLSRIAIDHYHHSKNSSANLRPTQPSAPADTTQPQPSNRRNSLLAGEMSTALPKQTEISFQAVPEGLATSSRNSDCKKNSNVPGLDDVSCLLINLSHKNSGNYDSPKAEGYHPSPTYSDRAPHRFPITQIPSTKPPTSTENGPSNQQSLSSGYPLSFTAPPTSKRYITHQVPKLGDSNDPALQKPPQKRSSSDFLVAYS